MKPSKLKFKLFSGGTLTINHQACLVCSSHACVKHCVSSTLDPVLKIEGGIPVLARTDMHPESGWCIECFACELDCELYGKDAITVQFPKDGARKREK